MHAPPFTVHGLLLIFMTALATEALADDQKPAGDDIERVTCRVLVVDALGNPVQGGIVVPSGFRTLAEPGSHWGWAKQGFGAVPKVETGPDGVAEIEVPKFVTEQQAIGKVTWLVDNPDHVVYRSDHDIADDPAKITLKDGYRIAATAVDAARNEPIKEHLYAVQSGYRNSLRAEWRQSKSGVLLSRVFDEAQITLRLIALTPGQPARFSDLITLRRAPNGRRVSLHDIRLQPGTRVEGQIDVAVPRPVARGKVAAYISAGDQPDLRSRQRLWTWSDETPIEVDGSFVFESLPRGDVVQLVAVCDGWISRRPRPENVEALISLSKPYNPYLANTYTIPQVYALDDAIIRPAIAMYQSATCKIKVTDPDGNPLAGASISMSPNQSFLRGGSSLLGAGGRTAERLKKYDGNESSNSDPTRKYKHPFHAVTDADGIAIIPNLPESLNVSLSVVHRDYNPRIRDGQRTFRVELKPGKTKTVEIRMEPKGENVLGGP